MGGRPSPEQLLHAFCEPVDLVLARQRPELELVAPAFPGSELDQLAAGPRVEASRSPVRAGLDAEDVGAFPEHAPDEVVWQLVSPEDFVGSEVEIAVDDGDRHASVRLRYDLVLEDLLDVAAL